MKCPECQFENRPDAELCTHCGTRLQPLSHDDPTTKRFEDDESDLLGVPLGTADRDNAVRENPGATYRPLRIEAEISPRTRYALTVHKTQGSEFGLTLLVLPNPCRLLSRELLYTALTRQKDRIVVLYQGEFHALRGYSDPYFSEAAKRLSNLFAPPNLVEIRDRMFEEGLIHKTRRGEAVRSKSEVIIADLLYSKRIPYEYEKDFTGMDGAKRFPDFFIEDADTGRSYFWEHLGMLRDPHYRAGWDSKRAWYRTQGIIPLEEGGGPSGTLIVTRDDPKGGIDSGAIEQLVQQIFGV